MPPRSAKRPAPVAPRHTASVLPVPAPRWVPFVLAALASLILVGLFSREISNTDFWWQLRTGQYIAQTHSLPDPDPFAYTTAGAGQTHEGEATVRHFNLRHEWMAQVLIYLVYRVGGFGGVVLARAMLLLAFCALVGLIAYRRCGRFYRALTAALLAATVVLPFAADRPFLVSFVFLAVTVAILEWRQTRLRWLLPVVMLIWANCHGGFVLGWLVIGAWCAEDLYWRLRGRPVAGDIQLWTICAISVLASCLNPNGASVLAVLRFYRNSSMTSSLIEWQPPALWPPRPFAILLLAAALVLIWRFRRVRVSDWLLFPAFAVAALTAGRNTFLIGFLAPILIAAYLPGKGLAVRYAPRVLAAAAAALLTVGLAVTCGIGQGFQFRAADWPVPVGAANFLLVNHITQPMFNTYESGGYLIWRLWPRERVFIDGRALSESVFSDHQRLLSSEGGDGARTAAALLDKYGVQVVVMNLFEYTSGVMYMLAPLLDSPAGMDWKIVYAAADGMIFMRHPPAGLPVRDPADILDAMESGCQLHIDHDPDFPGCAYNLGYMFVVNQEPDRARRWLRTFLDHAAAGSPQAERATRTLATLP